MKAKLYAFENEMEIRVANKVYAANEKESKKDFIARIKPELEKDFDEALDIVEVDNKATAKLDDEMLTAAYQASKGGVQEKILKSLCADRGIDTTKVEKTVRAKIETRDINEVKKSPEYLAAKENVGKLAEYTPTNAKEGDAPVKGVVKSISLNKTNTIIYYNVQQGDKLKCCTSKNTTLKFHEF